MSNETLGERRVRADFNASRSNAVANLKNGFYRLINVVDSITIPTDEGVEPSPESVAEINRLKAASIDALETAAMYAVKAATYKPGAPDN